MPFFGYLPIPILDMYLGHHRLLPHPTIFACFPKMPYSLCSDSGQHCGKDPRRLPVFPPKLFTFFVSGWRYRFAEFCWILEYMVWLGPGVGFLLSPGIRRRLAGGHLHKRHKRDFVLQLSMHIPRCYAAVRFPFGGFLVGYHCIQHVL